MKAKVLSYKKEKSRFGGDCFAPSRFAALRRMVELLRDRRVHCWVGIAKIEIGYDKIIRYHADHGGKGPREVEGKPLDVEEVYGRIANYVRSKHHKRHKKTGREVDQSFLLRRFQRIVNPEDIRRQQGEKELQAEELPSSGRDREG